MYLLIKWINCDDRCINCKMRICIFKYSQIGAFSELIVCCIIRIRIRIRIGLIIIGCQRTDKQKCSNAYETKRRTNKAKDQTKRIGKEHVYNEKKMIVQGYIQTSKIRT